MSTKSIAILLSAIYYFYTIIIIMVHIHNRDIKPETQTQYLSKHIKLYIVYYCSLLLNLFIVYCISCEDIRYVSVYSDIVITWNYIIETHGITANKYYIIIAIHSTLHYYIWIERWQ